MHDALIIRLVHLKSLVISLFHFKKIITENDKKTLLLFSHRGNRHFTIPQKGMGEWRVENGCTTDSKDKISVTLVSHYCSSDEI